MSHITIPKGDINLAGLLFSPPKTTTTKSPAIIVVHPGGGVKEQTASLYAQKLSLQGFVTISYDASFQGASGGVPHFLENPNERVSDVRYVSKVVRPFSTFDLLILELSATFTQMQH